MPEHDTDGSPAPYGDASAERFAASQQYVAGTGGARGLLVTVLGEFVRPECDPVVEVPTSAFLDVLGRLGVDGPTVRQTLRRAAADGWLVARRHGRYTRWRLTPAFAQFLDLGAARIFGAAAAQEHWDGWWLVVLARVPEHNRAGRHLLRTRLRWAGFGSPAPGVWVSPHTERRDEAELILAEAGAEADAQIFRSELVGGGNTGEAGGGREAGDGGDARRLVRQAWDLTEVARGHEEFVAEFTHPPSDDPIVRLVRLVHAWRHLLLQEPALPVALLPDDWVGMRAADLFHRQYAAWRPAANAEWQRISRPAPT